MKTMLTLVVSACLLVACTTTTTTTLKNPKTGETATCTGETTGPIAIGGVSIGADKKDDTDCIQKYLNQGYQRDSAVGSIF